MDIKQELAELERRTREVVDKIIAAQRRVRSLEKHDLFSDDKTKVEDEGEVKDEGEVEDGDVVAEPVADVEPLAVGADRQRAGRVPGLEGAGHLPGSRVDHVDAPRRRLARDRDDNRPVAAPRRRPLPKAVARRLEAASPEAAVDSVGRAATAE